MRRKGAKRGHPPHPLHHAASRDTTIARMAITQQSPKRHLGAPAFVNGGFLLPENMSMQRGDYTTRPAISVASLDAANSSLNDQTDRVVIMDAKHDINVQHLPAPQDVSEMLQEDEILFKGRDPMARKTAISDEDEVGWLLPQQARYEARDLTQTDTPKVSHHGENRIWLQSKNIHDQTTLQLMTDGAERVAHPAVRHEEDQSTVSQESNVNSYEKPGPKASHLIGSRVNHNLTISNANEPHTSQADEYSTDSEDTLEATWDKRNDKNQCDIDAVHSEEECSASSKAMQDRDDHSNSSDDDDDDDDEAITEDYIQNALHGTDPTEINNLLRFASRDIDLDHDLGMTTKTAGKGGLARSASILPGYEKPQKLYKRTNATRRESTCSSTSSETAAVKNASRILQVEASSSKEIFDVATTQQLDLVEHVAMTTRHMKRHNKRQISACPQVSDDELQQKLNAAWANDRSKKKERKKLREEQRQLGLLKSKGEHKRLSTSDAANDPVDVIDLKLKYPLGLTKQELWDEISGFCQSTRTELALPPFDTYTRKLLHSISSQLNIKSKSRGKGSDRFLVLSKPNRRCGFDDAVHARLERFMRRSWFARTDVASSGSNQAWKTSGRTSSGDPAVHIRPGEKVGEGAAALGQEKGIAKARAMMEKMGWSAGQGLGTRDNEGIINPIEQMVWYSKAGLG